MLPFYVYTMQTVNNTTILPTFAGEHGRSCREKGAKGWRLYPTDQRREYGVPGTRECQASDSDVFR